MSMPEEYFFSGYCRMQDGSRTVIVNPYKDIVVDELNAEKKEEE